MFLYSFGYSVSPALAPRINKLKLQGGNNIHAVGVGAVAKVLKDNSVITTVSPKNHFLVCFFLLPFYILTQVLSLIVS